MSHGYKKGGWKDKYVIYKLKTCVRGSTRKYLDPPRQGDGEEYQIKVKVDPEAKYFVLRYDKDPNAVVAMQAYADSVEAVNPEFANDIRAKLADKDTTPGLVKKGVCTQERLDSMVAGEESEVFADLDGEPIYRKKGGD